MNLVVIRRDDAQLEFTFTDSAGNPVDITGGTVYLTVKNERTDSDDDALIATSVSSFDAPASGVAVFDLSDTIMNIAPSVYVYDVQLVDPMGAVSSSTRGFLRVVQDVTVRIS